MFKSKKQVVSYGIIGLFICLVCSVVMFGCRDRSPEKIADRIATKITNKLELDETQQAQLQTLKSTVVEKLTQLKTEREATYSEIKAQLQSEAIDRMKMKQMLANHHNKMELMIEEFIDNIADFHETLTSEQRTKLIELLEDMHYNKKHCRFR